MQQSTIQQLNKPTIQNARFINGVLSFKFSGVKLGNIFSVLSNRVVIKLLNKIMAGGYFSTIMEYMLTGR